MGMVTSAIKATGVNIGDVANVVAFSGDYKAARGQGDSKAVAAVKGATSFAWGEMFFGGVHSAITKAGLTGKAALGANIGVMAAYIGVTAGAQMAGAMFEHTSKTKNNLKEQ